MGWGTMRNEGPKCYARPHFASQPSTSGRHVSLLEPDADTERGRDSLLVGVTLFLGGG